MNAMECRDYFNKDASSLKGKKLFLLDMDGTIYNENELFDGTLDLLDEIEKIGGRYVFITNNSSRSVKDYIAKVNRMGIRADAENFFTSAQATILYLKEHHPGRLIYCQGTHSLVSELREAGIRVTTEFSDEAGVILVGFDTELNFEKMTTTCRMLGRDLPYIATNPDFVCPVSFGYVPDCGSMCISYEKATGRKPMFIGKPEPTMIQIAMEKWGYSKDETLVIGDRLYTDIASGLNAGVTTICVLSGEAVVEDIVNGEQKPTFTFGSVKDVYEIIRGSEDSCN